MAPHSVPHTRLWGRKLVMARGALALLMVVALGLFIAVVPLHFAYLRMLCQASDACVNDARLTPERVESFTNLGVLADFYAAYSVALSVIFALVMWST